MTILPCLLVVASLFAALPTLADGKVYRWTDSQGHVHYGDQPSGNAREVAPKAPPANPGDPAAKSTAAAAPSAEECQRKKDQLATYRSAGKITETSALGETREFTAEQKQKLIEKTEQAIRDTCGAT